MADVFGSAQGAVDSLLGTLATVILDEAQLLGNIRGDVQFIKDEMESMNGFLLHVSEACEDDNHQVRAWKKQIRDVAVDSEQWVQRYQRWAGTAPRNLVPRILHFVLTIRERHGIATKIQELKARAQEVGERRQRYGVEVPAKEGRPPTVLGPQGTGRGRGDETEEQYIRRRCLEDPLEPDVTEEDKEQLVRWLTEQGDDIPPFRVIRVVGIGGRGKARLGSKVFDNGLVAEHFARRSWVNVDPEESSPLRVMEQLALDLERQDDVQHDMAVVDKVTRHLKGKRFLIVLSGIQNPILWAILGHGLGLCRGAPGSAVIVITDDPSFIQSSYYRTLDKVVDTVKFYIDRAIHLVEKTNRAEKKELLLATMVKLAPAYFYSKLVLHLLYVKPNRSLEELGRLCDSLKSGFCSVCNNGHQVLLFCYNDLPVDYRKCLLYLSIYPRGWKIRRTSLVRRWVVDGMITRRAGLTASEAAERCFNTLLDRGLLYCWHTGADGKSKLVGIPDQVFQFLVEMARAEGFADLNLTPDLAPFLSSGNGIQLQQVSNQRGGHRNFCIAILQSIICNCKDGDSAANEPEGPPHPILALLSALPMLDRNGFLKVLELEATSGFQEQHLNNICQVSELRYLNLRGTDVSQLPEDIHKLQNLETLDIRQTKVKTLPRKALLLRKLKHLLSGNMEYRLKEGDNALGLDESFSAVGMAHGIGNMTDMEILSHVEVSFDSCKSTGEWDKLVSNFERLQKLRKLGVVVHGKEPHLRQVLHAIVKLDRCLGSLSIHFKSQGEDNNTSIQNTCIELPKLLRCIKLSGFRDGLPSYVLKLSGLAKVTLRDTLLKYSDLQILGGLATLCCLMVQFITSCDEEIGENFVLKKDEFQSLKILSLEHTIITRLEFEQGAAPKLESIVWSYSWVNSLFGINDLKRLKNIYLAGSRVSSEVQHAIQVHQNLINVYN